MLLTQLVPSAAADREGNDYPGHSPDERSGQAMWQMKIKL
ncbi:hypothetical protein CLV31_104145 [Algoriphagus aquaeductus]|uniref:Uncharacterized protein n=1 Tax=Algoriphagus aquaeductus TaxID=475299 RepID=A0A326RWP9_9BACT|nr:hypothetical protein CLV31_104145 [Algoriphagus aquaeductus]